MSDTAPRRTTSARSGLVGRRQLLGWMGAGAVVAGVPLASQTAAATGLGTAAAPLTVWLPSPTDKVKRDRRFGPSTDTIRLQAARNEYESGQVIIRTTSGSTGINVTAGELTGPNGAKLTGIEVFEQSYIFVNQSDTGPWGPGTYPDALIPLAPTRTLTASSDANLGVWFTVNIPKDAPAGHYTGSLTITGGTAPVVVPIDLEVWNFELPDTWSTATAVSIWYQQVARAHNVPYGDPRHEPLMRKYYEFQLKNKMFSCDIPVPMKPKLQHPNTSDGLLAPGPGQDPEPAEFLARADQYLNDPRVNKFRIPLYTTGENGTGFTTDTVKLRQVVEGLRAKGLIDRGYFYYADEPQGDVAYANVRKLFDTVKAIAPEVPHVLTLEHLPEQKLLDFVHAWCFVITVPKPELPGIVAQLKERGDLVWWYTAVSHHYPLPGVFIADSGVGHRLLPWIQYDLGVEGYLFWSSTVFGHWTNDGYEPSNRWSDPWALGTEAGDGFLMYPGNAVGIDGPVGTVRLEWMREGFEDLEYLALYDRQAAALAASWGVPKPERGLGSHHDVLHDWLAPYRDDPALFHKVRAQVGAEVAQLFGTTPALVRIDQPTAGHGVVELITLKDAAVRINGITSTAVSVQGPSATHRVVLNLPAGEQTVTINVANSNFTRTVKVAGVATPHEIVINSFETEADVARLTTQEASATWSDQHPTTGGHTAKLVFNANVADPKWAGVYLYTLKENHPEQSIGRNDWSQLDAVAFDLYNDSDDLIAMYCDFHDPVNLDAGNPFYLAPRKQQRVVVPLTNLISDLPRITSIHLRVDRRSNPLTVYLDNVRFLRSKTGLPTPGTWSRQDADRRVTVQTVREDGTIGYVRENGAAWEVTSVAAGVTGTVAGAVDPAARMNLIGLTTSGQLKWSRLDGTWTHTVVDAQPTLTGTPTAVLDALGRLTYFARTTDGNLVRGRQTAPGATTWTTAYVLDGGGAKLRIGGDPASVQDPSGKLTYFVRSVTGELVHGWENAPGNDQWSIDLIRYNGGGAVAVIEGRPAVSQDISGRLTFHARTTAGGVITGWQDTPGNGPWRFDTLPTTVTLAGDPVSALDASGKLVYFARTTDNRLLHGWQRTPGNGPWDSTVIDGVAADGTVTQSADGRLHYFARLTSGRLGHWWQDAPGVGPWHSAEIVGG
ncbi:glycoside hydrolase domain-containing protein [Kribbella sp. NPDC051587]|uniref:glycoside hydrolase domain-containing protein n=1 Tax=Kribbella sp. NPDC051587 TaxID=3364119 RepID=UPI00379B4B30